MRVLLLNQAFYPDYAATAVHLADFAKGLAEAGHEVVVVCSQRGYADPKIKYLKYEKWQNVEIHRVFNTCFGKTAKWQRAMDFFSFIVFCCLKLLFLKRFDAVVALTSPPLISFIGASYSKLFGSKFYYWVMDLNPDEAIAAGWLKEGSFIAKILEYFSLFSLKSAEKIIVLDDFMSARVCKKGIDSNKLEVIPPWSHEDEVMYDSAAALEFRKEFNLLDKYIVLYAGNHSPCHPLDTLMQVAKKLREQEQIRFLFIGGGSEQKRVVEFARENNLENIICRPYLPKEKVSGMLSAADIHAVVMGEPYVGIIHPSKIYNILLVGGDVLYIGPVHSHITELKKQFTDEINIYSFTHGQVNFVKEFLVNKVNPNNIKNQRNVLKEASFLMSKQMTKIIGIFENNDNIIK